MYLCGADHAIRCGLNYDIKPAWTDGLVIVARPEPSACAKEMCTKLLKTAETQSEGRIVYITTETADISSTLIRDKIIEGDFDALSSMLHPEVLDYIREHKISFCKTNR